AVLNPAQRPPFPTGSPIKPSTSHTAVSSEAADYSSGLLGTPSTLSTGNRDSLQTMQKLCFHHNRPRTTNPVPLALREELLYVLPSSSVVPSAGPSAATFHC
ncbi:unnamed protein product, partial [Ectocarpus sp. 12 AP-2014]